MNRLHNSAPLYAASPSMKAEEAAAHRLLVSLEGGEVVYEPDGNVPPDFVLGRTTAIEVRRLNQHHFTATRVTALDEGTYPLIGTLRKVLCEYGPPSGGSAYWVFLSFERPFKRGRAAATAMRAALELFLASGGHAPAVLPAGENVELHFERRSTPSQHRFSLGVINDEDGGGAVASLYVKNINYCIEEKARKVEPYRSRYPTWWLLLVDTMGWSLDLHEVEVLRSHITDLQGFARIVVTDIRGEVVRLKIDGSKAT